MIKLLSVPTALLVQLIYNVINIGKLRLVSRFTLVELRLNVLIEIIVINGANLAIIVIVLRLRHRNIVQVLAIYAL